ncbi:MAG: galactokinase [Planctomycetes bacterium]|nr:galactokinase [Planctomycetota bacterium]
MDRPLFTRVRALARARLGSGGRLFFASGRVNLLGAHIDYHGGCVLPVAVDRGVAVVARRRDDRRFRLASAEFSQSVEGDLDALPTAAEAGWAAYPVGIFATLEAAGHVLPGLDLVFAGDLPVGAGLSSSAAILVATAVAVAAIADFPLAPIDAARFAHRAETGFVGVKCGIMDPFASALGRPGHALWLDCKDQSHDWIALPTERMAFVMLDSMTRRELKDGGFNQRVAESLSALAKLKTRLPKATCLRDVSVEDLERHRELLPDLEWKRARHVVTEVARVRRARELLARGELLEFGQLMWLSHLSSRHLYEVSTPRLDALQELSLSHPGCFGARLTGAGFGGCALAVVAPDAVESFAEQVAAGFERRFGERAAIHSLGFGSAPSEVEES